MARIMIRKKNGTSSRYFWSDTDANDTPRKTVYKQTSDGIKRMKGVHYDATENRIVKQ